MQLDVAPPFVVVKPVAGERAYYDLADEDAPWELLDGRLVMSPVSYRHEQILRVLLTLLSGWLDERGGPTVLGSRYPLRLDPRWSPEPDPLVVTDEHGDRITEQRLEGPADEHPRDLAGLATDRQRALRPARCRGQLPHRAAQRRLDPLGSPARIQD